MPRQEDDSANRETDQFTLSVNATHSTVFKAGDRVAGRFRIVRFIAQGGMGEVYEAEDEDLGERVALKTIRNSASDDPRSLDRFKREILLARKVTHPNVCRIFDVFYHKNIETHEVTTLLSMELLSGESLDKQIARSGKMNLVEALPLIRQMADGLHAAHKAGIVHRDFKSANVMLVPGNEETRVVITDFGLAKQTQQPEDASLTGAGMFVGTPDYMSPEQVSDGEITPATDIYALGVVMFEMSTGSRPFIGKTPLQIAMSRLQNPPTRPVALNPNIDLVWEKSILRALELEPSRRFSTTPEIVKALEQSQSIVPTVPLAFERKWNSRRFLVLALVVLGIIIGTSVYLLRNSAFQTRAKSHGFSSRASVAVLGFKNLTGSQQAEWLSTAMSEMLNTELAAGEKLRIIPAENVARMKIELAIVEADSLAADTLSKVRSDLDTKYVVLGSYVALGGASHEIRIDIHLQDTTAGETIASISQTGSQDDLFDLVSSVGARLREKLGVTDLSSAESGMARASLPSNTDAARLYSDGLAKLRKFDALSAKETLQQAAALDPSHPLVHSALAEAWSALGYDQNAGDEARKAFQLAGSLSREDRLVVEGNYWKTTHQWDKAIDSYKALFQFFPDNPDYGLRLAAVQVSAGRGSEALETIDLIRKASETFKEDPRLDLAEATATRSLADSKRQLLASSRAIQKGQKQGALLLVADAQIEQGYAWQTLGEYGKTLSASEAAQLLYSRAGDFSGVAQALTLKANSFYLQGDLAKAKEMYQQSISFSQTIGNLAGISDGMLGVANVVWQQGNLEEARKAYLQLLEIARQANNKKGIAGALNNLAMVAQEKGDLVAAQDRYTEALSTFRETGDNIGQATALSNIADVLTARGDMAGARKAYEQSADFCRQVGDAEGLNRALLNDAGLLLITGDLPGALKNYEASLEICKKQNDKTNEASALLGIAEVQLYGDDLDASLKTAQDALAMQEGSGEQTAVAKTQLMIARVLLQSEQYERAESSARTAVEEFANQKADDDEIFAQAVLAETLLAQKKVKEAIAAGQRAAFLAGKTQNMNAGLRSRIVSAQILSASGRLQDVTKAAGELDAIASKAIQNGLLAVQFESTLDRGTLLISTDQVRGRALLDAIAKEAKSKGFLLISRKASSI